MQLQLEGRSALVTGATRGIGRAVAELLLDEGAAVLAVGRTPERCARLAEELSRHGHRLVVLEQDLTRPGAAQSVVAAAVAAFGGLDILVNNASTFEPGAPGPDDWAALFELKLMGYVALASAAIPHLQRTGGSITNVAGVAALIPNGTAPHVGSINAAVIAMSRSLALAQAGSGVRVNVVSPGLTATDRYYERLRRLEDGGTRSAEEARAVAAAPVPVGHPADPAELARAIVLLASPVMRSTTGAHLVVDGGQSLGGPGA